MTAVREAAAVLRPAFHLGYREEMDVSVESGVRHHLMEAFPDYGYRGEETAEVTSARDPQGHLWLVDPHDGTKAAARGHRGAAVSIALLRQGVPVLGIVFAYSAPDDQGDLFWWAEGLGPLRRNGNEVERTWPSKLTNELTVVMSQDADSAATVNAAVSHPMRYRGIPGIAYRLALVAAGEGDIAISLNDPTGWDVAGGHALLLAAGGNLFDEGGRPVTYDATGTPKSSLHTCFGGSAELVQEVCHRHWEKALSRRQQQSKVSLASLKPGKTVADAGILARAQGCLLGQLVGDALGSLVESASPKQINALYPDGPRFLKDGGHWDTIAGQPTDDSELALSLARSIVEGDDYDEETAARAYARWFDSNPFDIGMATTAALSPASRAMHQEKPIAIAARSAADANTQSNGALMRLSPLAIFGAALEPAVVAKLARIDAGLTHPHEVCRSANVVFAAAISFAIRTGLDAQAVYRHALTVAKGENVEPAVMECLKAAEDRGPEDFTSQMGWVRIAFQNAFHQLLHASSVEAAVVDTVRAGGDTDTNAAIAGALLGAVHGRLGIPKQWMDRVLTCRPIKGLQGVSRPRPGEYWPVDALALAEQLLLAGLRVSGRREFAPQKENPSWDILEVPAPAWDGKDQVDPTPYQMSADEKMLVRQLAPFLSEIGAVDSSSQGMKFEWKTATYLEISEIENHRAIQDFFSISTKLLGQVDYDGFPVNQWLAQPDFLERVQFPQLRVVLTWMTRGEKFCWGFWAGELANGNLMRLITRLMTLANGDDECLEEIAIPVLWHGPSRAVEKSQLREGVNMWIPKELGQMAMKLKDGRRIHRIAVRDLLRMFKAERRGMKKVYDIRAALDTLGLVTDPDFQSVWIDGPIRIRLKADNTTIPSVDGEAAEPLEEHDYEGDPPLPQEEEETVDHPQTDSEDAAIVIASDITVEAAPGELADPTFRIGNLPAANKPLTTVGQDDTLKKAITMMLQSDYSQLPVMHGDREVKGMITWKSVASRYAIGGECDNVRNCIEKPQIVDGNVTLFDAIPTIVKHGYVLVRDSKDRRITGLVTASDLNLQFQNLAEPFLLLREIELHIRQLLQNKISDDDFECLAGADTSPSKVKDITDLSFGDYVRLLQRPQVWKKLSLSIDQSSLTNQLEEVRQIRNDVMHFDPDPMTPKQLEVLKRAAKFMQQLYELLP